MPTYEIPLSPTPQVFVISLAEKTYRATVLWCKPSQTWLLSLSTTEDVPVVQSIPLVPGVDLLSQYAHLQFGGKLFVQTVGDVTKIPGFQDLGVSGLLFFVTEDE